MIFRHYQSTAIDKCLEWFCNGKERPLIVLPTGTGKSLVQAGLIHRIINDSPYVRIICATHSKELVSQNYAEMLELCPDLSCGIYSAGLDRRESGAQILFAGIQSIYNKAIKLGHTDIIIVDEAHTISKKSETRWGKFFADMKAINPNVQIIGLTATPYRLDSGNLVPNSFNGVCYEYPIIEAIKDGYLCEIISAPVQTHLKTVGVHKRGGEFIAGELERAVDTDDLNTKCVAEIIKFGQDRKSWIVFCAGKTHARHITELLVQNGIDAECVTDDTLDDDRDRIVKDHKSGKLKCLVNNTIFTTGYNNPALDLIACLRPTESEGLWVQICGRGMRLYQDKQNCLLLDFGRNIDRHGPIDKIKGKHKNESSGDGEAPLKQCPSCFEPVHAAVRHCPACGHEFPPNEINLTMTASSGAILSTQLEPQEYGVLNVKYKKTFGKDGKPDSMMVVYTTLSGQIREWVFFNHPLGSTPKRNAIKWAETMGGQIATVDEAINMNWKKPVAIEAFKDGKFWKIKKYIF
jgi:DNA repair protein RadD